MLISDKCITYTIKSHRLQLDGRESQDWSKIYSGKLKADMVIFGNCQALVGLDPSILSSDENLCYNLSMNGYGFPLQKFKIEQFLENNEAPQAMVIALDFRITQRRSMQLNPIQFLPELYFNEELYNGLREYDFFNWKDLYIPLYRYTPFIPGFLKKNNSPPRVKDSYGHVKVNQSFKKSRFNKILDELYSKEIPSDDPDELIEFILKMKQKGIQIYTVAMPVLHYKLLNAVPEKTKNALRSNNIPFFELESDHELIDQRYFYDEFHMNKIGSQLISEWLKTRIDQNWK